MKSGDTAGSCDGILGSIIFKPRPDRPGSRDTPDSRLLLVQGARDAVFASPADLKAVRIAFGFFVAFLVLAPVAAVLSAIPYGGSGVPKEVWSLFAVTQAVGMYLLYRGLLRGTA